MIKQRPDFVCWHCQRHFGQTLELERQTQVLVECPYCHSECVVELEPYQTQITEIMRGGNPTGDDPGAAKPQYRFPARVPTQQPQTR
jgi:DNA-directed RNA polymerase subunit RPC12/RpoP